MCAKLCAAIWAFAKTPYLSSILFLTVSMVSEPAIGTQMVSPVTGILTEMSILSIWD